MRLQRYIAMAGIDSRRHAEELIAAGKVTVNGKKITEMGYQVTENDKVCVSGKRIRIIEEKKYVLLYKPFGEVTTVRDPEGRPTVMDHFRKYPYRIYPVGRLDFDSEGLLLLTNDGDLANQMMHPSFEIDKTYYVKVRGPIDQETCVRISKGVMIDQYMTSPCKIKIVKEEKGDTALIVVIHEGRNRQVRKMFEAVGSEVIFLKRIGFGPLSLGELKRGEWRELSTEEVEALKKSVYD